MFKLLNNIYPNQRTSHKKNTSILFNKESNSIFKNFKNDCNINDFEDLSKENSFENNNIKQKNDCNKKEFLKNFAKNILNTILDSRKDKNNNFNKTINSNSNSDSNTIKDFSDISYNIEELFLYDDYLQNKNDIQKFIIEFYLVNNKNKKKSELVEKWKFSYKSNDDNNDRISEDININYLKNKILILQKSIITYSRLLPLYQYIINNNNEYTINFKIYNNKRKKKGVFSNKPSGNVSLKNSFLFSFKMNIKYYFEKEIKTIFNETEEYIDINIKNTNKFKSLSFHKAKPKITLNEFEIINNIDNNPITKNNNNCLNEIKTCPTEVNNNKINDIESLSDSSSFILNIHDYNTEENKKNNIDSVLENIKEKENKKNENQTKENNTCKRKCSIFSNSYETTEDYSPRNSELKSNGNKENKISSDVTKKIIIKKNNKVNNILKEYYLLKDMIQKMPDFSNIKTQKLKTYLDVFE